MPILNSFQHLKSGGVRAGILYKAQVIKNDDPKEWSRIKFKIPKLFEFSPDDSPWAIPESNDTDGASKKSGHIDVPCLDSWVLIEFQNGSLYHPVYSPMYINDEVKMTGDAQSGNINPYENYPYRKVHKYSNGMVVVVDTKSNELLIHNPGTATINIDGDTLIAVNKGDLTVGVAEGNAYVSAKKNIEVVSTEGDLKVSVLKGNASVYVKQKARVQAEGGIDLIGDGSGGDLAGIVTANYICPITGDPHRGSENVKCTMGGIKVAGISP
jgi:hypothetical protein